MEFTTKDKLLSLIFPAICVLYGVLELMSGIKSIYKAAGVMAVAAGCIVGLLILIFKINTVEYLKVMTITTVISYLLWVIAGGRFLWELLGDIFNICALLMAVIISTLKIPDGTCTRDRIIVFFSNPVFYSLLKWLWKPICNFLADSGALVL